MLLGDNGSCGGEAPQHDVGGRLGGGGVMLRRDLTTASRHKSMPCGAQLGMGGIYSGAGLWRNFREAGQ